METSKTEKEKFEQVVKISPAYDERHKGKGICCARMHLVLKGKMGSVQLAVSTAMYLRCTFEWKETCIQKGSLESWEPRGDTVSYCSPIQLHDWQEGRENCDWLGCTCYGDVGYSMADAPFELLLTKGSDAVFEWLEDYYYSVFGSRETAKDLIDKK